MKLTRLCLHAPVAALLPARIEQVPKEKAIPMILCLGLADERAMACTLIDIAAENRGLHPRKEAHKGSHEHVCEMVRCDKSRVKTEPRNQPETHATLQKEAILFDRPPIDGSGRFVVDTAVVTKTPLEDWEVFHSIPRSKNVPHSGFFCCLFYNAGLLPRDQAAFTRAFLSSAVPPPNSLRETSLFRSDSTRSMQVGVRRHVSSASLMVEEHRASDAAISLKNAVSS